MSSTLERGTSETTVLDPVVLAPASTRLPWTRILLVAAAVGLCVFFAGHWLFYDRFRISTDDAFIDTDQVMAMSRISERVAEVYVQANQPVKKGQLLVQLDDAPERARLALAKGNLRSLDAAASAAQQSASLERQTQSAELHGEGGALDAARRAADAAESQAVAADRTVGVGQADLASARAAANGADAAVPAALRALRHAESERSRNAQLMRDGYVSASTLDAAETALAQARSGYESALAAASTAHAAVRQADAKLAQARANAAAAHSASAQARAQVPVAQAKLEQSAAPSRVPDKEALQSAAAASAGASAAQVRLAELDLQSTRILSPVDGWVSSRNVQVGQIVSPGQALITIAPANHVFVTANYKETQMRGIRAGAIAEITVDACRGQTFRGTVESVNPVAQSALSTMPTLTAPSNFVKVPQRIPVRISLPADGRGCVFRPGMSVETAILTKS